MVWYYRFPTSTYECQAWLNTTVTCARPEFGQFPSNADIAGPGVVWSFIIALILTIIVNIIVLLIQAIEVCSGLDILRSKKDDEDQPDQESWRRLLDSFLVSLSDQQIITGLALLVVTEFNAACSISAYHYDLVCNLVLMSTIVHLCSMTVIEHYFNVWWLGGIRVVILVGNFILGFLLFIQRGHQHFPVGVPSKDEPVNSTSLVMPAVCFMDNSTIVTGSADETNNPSGFVEYLLLLLFFCVAGVTSILHTRLFKQGKTGKSFRDSHWTYWVRGCLSVGALFVSIFVISQFFDFQNWMRKSGWFGDDDGEYSMDSFGQIVPLVLLTLPVLALLEAVADQFGAKTRKKS